MGRRPVIPDRLSELMGGGGQHCWTVEDLQEALAREGFDADPSSIFRAVNRLEDAGTVHKVALGDRRIRYELAGEHHEHLVCDGCGAVEPLPCALVDALVHDVWDRCGFAVSGHRLVLTGTCGTCGLGSEPPAVGVRAGGSGPEGAL
ncbi:MAG: Fur family transcriptional regulator [Acidimicrobiales bacterium]